MLYYHAVQMDVRSSVTKCTRIKQLDLEVPNSANIMHVDKISSPTIFHAIRQGPLPSFSRFKNIEWSST